ncbi:DUF1549 and DUF1553 domain-containing protein [Rubripirellula sp.]|nr:DUF1549 and DUF1553 domain-containing protein [Rubripirellula sp.]
MHARLNMQARHRVQVILSTLPVFRMRLATGSIAFSFYRSIFLVSLWTSLLVGNHDSNADDLQKLQSIIQDEASKDEVPIDAYDREHWAYQPIVRPNLPKVKDANWPTNSIDLFLLSRMEIKGFSPAPKTDRYTLIRRLYFDMLGVPPSVEEVQRFVEDGMPNAYRRLVDRVLASPQVGRRWGQYWLDLARFAETDGYEHDKVRETAWQYRDWVVASLNDDRSYDEFVRLQIAGDLIDPNDQQAKIATAFCLSGPDMPDINSQEERKHVLLNEVTSTVGSVLLSLQIGCAQCHDHKYDAISQADFYRLRAFFEPSVHLTANQSVTTLSLQTDQVANMLYARGDWRRPVASVEPAYPRVVNLNSQAVEFAKSVETSSTDQEDRDTTPGATLPERLQLAEWLTGDPNPLVARSIVNRVWQFHFQRGLSTTPSDFGLMGQEPTHPELLDYLAAELIENGWSLKRLHRELLTSSFYQTESRPPVDQESLAKWDDSLSHDPDNRCWSRFPRRRLDAEAIRDAMLSVAGLLNLEGDGPGVRPPLPQEMVKTLKSGQWEVSEQWADHYRQSIYIFARRNLTYPLFATFDRPAANCSCPDRQESTTPLQSLLLMNSEFSSEIATTIAGTATNALSQQRPEIITEVNIAEAVQHVLLAIMQQPPSESLHQTCVEFVSKQMAIFERQDRRASLQHALADLSLALLNSNSFFYVD